MTHAQVSPRRRAQVMERIGCWDAAARNWEVAGEPEEAAACRRIIEARRAGDAWRARLNELTAFGMPFEQAAAQATKEQSK
jgi:hypothetical protein